jgi:hypothetical protein
MMKNWRKTALAAALTGALGLPGAAGAITVAGITFTTGAIFETIDLFEGERAGGPGNNNGVIDLPGEELVGIGIVNRIRDKDTLAILWENGDNGRELTIYFHSYIAENFVVGGGVANIGFTGGVIEIYSDPAENFDASGTQAAAIATATDGVLWLSLEGSPIGANSSGSEFGGISDTPITLVSEATSLVAGEVDGRGALDVTGGLTAGNFDTNTFNCTSEPGAPDACPNDADKTFTSSGQLLTTSATQPWGFFGTGEVQNFAVPEPGILALLGLGLAGFGFATRRKYSA